MMIDIFQYVGQLSIIMNQRGGGPYRVARPGGGVEGEGNSRGISGTR